MEQAPDPFATADDSADRDPERPDEDAAAGREPTETEPGAPFETTEFTEPSGEVTDVEGPEADAAPSEAEPEEPEEAGALEVDLVGEPDGAGAALDEETVEAETAAEPEAEAEPAAE